MRTVVLDTSESDQTVEEISLHFIATELASAFCTADGLSVAVQPQYNLNTGQIIAAEALIRWRHPIKGNIPPEKFIPVLDNLNLESALFEFVLNNILDLLCTLRLLKIECPISINASALLMSDAKVIENLVTQLSRASLPARLINIEITEDKKASNFKSLATNLALLREQGFGISIDDFGTGHSTLQRLISLPFSELKIDKTFVSKMFDCESSREIILSSLELGKKLGLRVVAEGIENREQVRLLRIMGCQCGQGFGLSHPLKIKELITKLLRNLVMEPNTAPCHNKAKPYNYDTLEA